ncbi:MAG: class I SAM-dependent methyltransferase [Myxococcota bacterium]
MSTQSLGVTPEVRDYLRELSGEPDVLQRLREETARLPNAGMQICPEQGSFMRWLVGVIGARRYLEIGVFTGYSSLCVALALPDDGRIVACDVNREWTGVAKRYLAEAGLAHKFDLRLGPALATLAELARANERFDFAFIDADKENYDAYYERCVELVRENGLIAIDNALWDGKVANPDVKDASTRVIRELNARVARDPRVSASLVPIGDGLLLARKLRS